MSRLSWILQEISSRLWIRASLYGLAAIVTALCGLYFKHLIPANWLQKIGADAVDGILNIMAASMLSVTIFSLSTLVSALGAASSNVTPRTARLLMEDRRAQNALSTFIGAFIFSIVGIITLKTGAYGYSGRLILFVVTVVVIVLIVITLLRWIDHLMRLGRVQETITKVEEAAAEALEARLRQPYLGGRAFDGRLPAGAAAVAPDSIGYVQHIDMDALHSLSLRHNADIRVLAPPGKFVDAHTPLAATDAPLPDDAQQALRHAFIVGKERSFRQDPRFGIIVLSEIAARALSPAINDYGTAIYIIGVGVRLLSRWAARLSLREDGEGPLYPRLYVAPLSGDDLFDDFFSPVSRNAAGIAEVQVRLQKTFASLAATGDADLRRLSLAHARLSLRRVSLSQMMEEDRQEVVAAAQSLLPQGEAG